MNSLTGAHQNIYSLDVALVIKMIFIVLSPQITQLIGSLIKHHNVKTRSLATFLVLCIQQNKTPKYLITQLYQQRRKKPSLNLKATILKQNVTMYICNGICH